MRSRTLVIGDIHGGYRALIQVLERAAVTPADRLIFLGDYVDGWSEPHLVIEKLLELEASHDCIFLKGNHEDLLLQWLLTKQENPRWLRNGGESSVAVYTALSEVQKNRHQAFFERLKLYVLDAKNRLFVHAGFTNQKGVEAEFFPEMLYWDRTLWELALALDPHLSKSESYYPQRLKIYDEIFIGHTPVLHVGATVPLCRAGIWNIDTGAAFKGRLTLMDVERKTFWQSDPLPDLYPDESGRNSI